MEIALIKEYETQDREKGYNILEGGNAPSMPEEIRQKISKALMGNKNNLGHPCSEEKKEKIRQAQIGCQFTEEHKKKLSEAAKLRHVPCSEEKKKKLSESYPNKKQVYCEELNTIFPSVQECARQIGAPATNVSKVCRGRGHTVKGYHVRFYNNDDEE